MYERSNVATGITVMSNYYPILRSGIGGRGLKRNGMSGLAWSWLAKLSNGHGDDTKLGEVTQLFQACKSLEEICKVARNRLQAISSDLSGALYLTSTTGEYLETVMSWGAMEPDEDIFSPDDCWALRCGRPYMVDCLDDLIACPHTHVEAGDWHLCLPLIANGEAFGILYFCGGPRDNRTLANTALTSQKKLMFYVAFAETLAMALANIRLREALQNQAIRDPLTKLFNRRYLQETMPRELKRVNRAEEPLSLVMVDIDHFKQFNDTYGHDAGDEALKSVAELLQNRTRAEDIACRLGGEEFALVYPGMSADVAISRVESIRQEVEAYEISHLGKTLKPVTVSAGIAVFPSHGTDYQSLMRAADQALYQSKKAGRNRVTLVESRAQNMQQNENASPLRLVHSKMQRRTPESIGRGK